MNWWLLVLTHLVVLFAGYLSGVRVTHTRTIRTAITHEEPAVTHPTIHDRLRGRGPTPGAVALFLILGGLVVVGFGVQQSAYQSSNVKHDDCNETWGQALIVSVQNRTTASKAYENATARRDDALDAIILTVAAFQKHPPEATPKDFRAVISEFVAAKLHRDKVKRHLGKVRKRNPYPQLDCPQPETWLDRVVPG